MSFSGHDLSKGERRGPRSAAVSAATAAEAATVESLLLLLLSISNCTFSSAGDAFSTL